MDSKDFYNLVKMTRYAQKKYLSAQSEIEKQGWLATSKGYEKKLDDEIECVVKELIILQTRRALSGCMMHHSENGKTVSGASTRMSCITIRISF